MSPPKLLPVISIMLLVALSLAVVVGGFWQGDALGFSIGLVLTLICVVSISVQQRFLPPPNKPRKN